VPATISKELQRAVENLEGLLLRRVVVVGGVASRLEYVVNLEVGAVRGHRGRGDGCLQPEDRAEVEDLLLRPTHDGLSLDLHSSHGVRWLTQRRLVEG
jgi:hypothetical protein